MQNKLVISFFKSWWTSIELSSLSESLQFCSPNNIFENRHVTGRAKTRINNEYHTVCGHNVFFCTFEFQIKFPMPLNLAGYGALEHHILLRDLIKSTEWNCWIFKPFFTVYLAFFAMLCQLKNCMCVLQQIDIVHTAHLLLSYSKIGEMIQSAKYRLMLSKLWPH